MSIFSVPTFCVITGANEGFGRATAILIAEKLAPSSTICIVDRGPWEETTKAIKQKAGYDIEVKSIDADLADEASFGETNRAIFEGVDTSRYEHAILIHQAVAAHLDRYSRDLDDLLFLQRCTMVNISGPIVMTAEFFKTFGAPGSGLRKTVVNVTSVSACIPQKTGHIFGMGKAARNQFFRVMALEESGAPSNLRILGYRPGAIDDELTRQQWTSVDPLMRADAEAISKWEGFLKSEQSAAGLITTLEEDKYENAAIVKTYDVLGIPFPGNLSMPHRGVLKKSK